MKNTNRVSNWISFLVLMLSLIGIIGRAEATLWDLENTALGIQASVSQTVTGITLTITREGGVQVQIEDVSGVPANFGDRTLSPFNNTSAAAFIGNFSSMVSNVGFDFGDFTPSDTDVMTLQAFSGANATGTLLGSISSAPCCSAGTGFAGASIFLNVSGINSIRFIGGSASFPNSLYVDNFQATAAVPEPSSLWLLGSAVLGLVSWNRRKTK